jgi:hypothetical protein
MIPPDRRPRLFAAFAAAVALCASLPALAAQVKDVRVGSHPKFTRIVFELDGSAGYQVERAGTDAAPELKITIDATSSARMLRAIGDVRGVKVDAGTKARAHIALGASNLRVHEMMLTDPPRIVIDLHKPETAVAAADKPAAKPKADAKSEAKAAPKPEVKEIAKAEVKERPSAEPKEAAAPKPAPAPKAAPAPAPVAPKTEAAPTPAPAPAPKADAAPKAITPPAPAEPAKPPAPPAIEPAKPKTEPEHAATAPIVPPPAPPHDTKEYGPPAPATPTTPEGVATLPAPAPVPAPPAPPAAVVPTPTPAPVRPQPTPAVKPVAPDSGGSFTDHLSDPIWLGGIAVAVLGLAAIGIVMRRRRALPNDLDVTAIAEEVERSAESSTSARIPSGGFAMGDDQPSASSETTTFASLFEKPAQDSEPARSAFAPPRPAAPTALPEAPSPMAAEAEDSLFDDAGEMPGEPDAREGDAPMNQEMDLPVDRRPSPPAARMGGSAAPSPSASPDVTRILQDMERRIATLEARLDESNEAREKLERQVAAQSEELRVQRAAIARTQRALRTMTRGDEDKATEPALRDGDTQAKTRVTP